MAVGLRQRTSDTRENADVQEILVCMANTAIFWET